MNGLAPAIRRGPLAAAAITRSLLRSILPPAGKPELCGGLRHMSQPFSGMPNPGSPRPFKRRFQPPGAVQEALRGARETVRRAQEALRRALPRGREALRGAQRYSENLWLRGK